MFTNFDDVVPNEHHAVERLSLGHVERCTTSFFCAPSTTDEGVTHDDVVLVVTWVDMQRRVA